MLRVGVVGCGYWGPNLIRNFTQLPDSEVAACSDLNEGRLDRMRTLYPRVETTRDYTELLARDDIAAIIIATPPQTHFEVATKALEAGKHVFVEKPLATSSRDCELLLGAAKKRGLTLMVGHTFVFTAAVNKIKELIKSGELGEIFYINTTRVNLGIFQESINVVWDLAPHDISIMNYILDSMPEEVCAHGHPYIRQKVEDVAFLNVKYPGNIMAHVHVSWLNPNKIRKTTVVGSKKMLVYDDVSSLEKIRIYDKGVTVQPHYDTFGEFQLSYRFGDIFIPKLDDSEPLKVACQHFIHCIEKDAVPRSSGQHGLDVVRVIEAANESLRNSGVRVPLHSGAAASPQSDSSGRKKK
ncbi:MAG: Gfo/Idh/MocA family oxidoreductase [Candidatus Latescibacterota bacterium]|nr:MAG: Gfo/Idh/MocA family oxidoreductase [Candidatus Latescibacterota bacterium]